MAYLNGKRVFAFATPLGSNQETDPTVPEWAKQPDKPTYTADEVGAIPADKLPEAISEALDQANIVARVYDLIKNGGVVGFVDENNNIVLTGNIADGEYTLKYENADGTYTDIGTLEVGAVEPEQPKVVNLFNPDTAIYNARLGASGDLKAEGSCNGAVVTDFIDITDLNGKIKISGNFVQSTSYSGLKFGKLVVYDASGVMAGTSSAITYDITPDGREYDLTNCKTTYPTATQIRLCLSIKASETITAEDVADVVIELIE